MFALRILEFIGGYIEYIFVPPFIAEWQRITAEKSVSQMRRITHARILGDMKSIGKNLRNTNVQIDELFEKMKEQEIALKSLSRTPTENARKKNIVATYMVHIETQKKLRNFVHILTRIQSELMVRLAILQTSKDSVSLKTCPEYVKDFEIATKNLLNSENQTDVVMQMIYSDGMNEPEWEKMLNNFIEQMGDYDIPDMQTFDQIKSFD